MKRLGVAQALVDGELVAGDVGVEDGVVVEVAILPSVGSGTAIPGMVDLQVNGYAGVDFLTSPAEEWAVAARAMARDGVTGFLANLITSPPDLVTQAVQVGGRVVADDDPGAARCLGVHLEGPFLSPARRGTHPAEHLRDPDLAFVQRLFDAGPVVGVTIAPELPGALDVIRALSRRGLVVSLGHSDADAMEAHAGFFAGARTVTHVFNGMSQPTSRAPGLTGVALVRPDVTVQMISDGVHLAPETVALVVQAARTRFVLVTDALSATGAPDGRYRVGEVEVTMTDGRARNADGGLAGSVLQLGSALRGPMAAGATFEETAAAVTSRPADLLGRPDVGRLRPGAVADVAVLDDGYDVVATYLAGVRAD